MANLDGLLRGNEDAKAWRSAQTLLTGCQYDVNAPGIHLDFFARHRADGIDNNLLFRCDECTCIKKWSKITSVSGETLFTTSATALMLDRTATQQCQNSGTYQRHKGCTYLSRCQRGSL